MHSGYCSKWTIWFSRGFRILTVSLIALLVTALGNNLAFSSVLIPGHGHVRLNEYDVPPTLLAIVNGLDATDKLASSGDMVAALNNYDFLRWGLAELQSLRPLTRETLEAVQGGRGGYETLQPLVIAGAIDRCDKARLACMDELVKKLNADDRSDRLTMMQTLLDHCIKLEEAGESGGSAPPALPAMLGRAAPVLQQVARKQTAEGKLAVRILASLKKMGASPGGLQRPSASPEGGTVQNNQFGVHLANRTDHRVSVSWGDGEAAEHRDIDSGGYMEVITGAGQKPGDKTLRLFSLSSGEPSSTPPTVYLYVELETGVRSAWEITRSTFNWDEHILDHDYGIAAVQPDRGVPAASGLPVPGRDFGTPEPRATERPAERVSPAPEVNAQAVIWRTPQPPTDPQAGDVWVNPKDGTEMVYIAAGEFLMGSTEADISALVKENPKLKAELFADEKPQFRATLPGYWIDKCEVTVAQYRKFCQETGQKMPEAPDWGWQDDHPMVMVIWHDAVAYAKWAGKRLPTELEWEKAARGTDGRKYPWGSQWPPPAASGNFNDEAWTREYPDVARIFTEAGFPPLRGYDDGYAEAALVGKFPKGASPYGALDMAGNMWEWCGDWYEEKVYQRYVKGDLKPPASGTRMVLRGGSWFHDLPTPFRCAGRSSDFYPDVRYFFVGFRCVRGPS